MMKQKILMITMGLDIGGAETHIVELSKELKRRGYDILVASSGGIYVREIEDYGIRHEVVPMNTRNAGMMFRSFFLLRRLIKRENRSRSRENPGFCGRNGAKDSEI